MGGAALPKGRRGRQPIFCEPLLAIHGKARGQLLDLAAHAGQRGGVARARFVDQIDVEGIDQQDRALAAGVPGAPEDREVGQLRIGRAVPLGCCAQGGQRGRQCHSPQQVQRDDRGVADVGVEDVASDEADAIGHAGSRRIGGGAAHAGGFAGVGRGWRRYGGGVKSGAGGG